VLEEIAFGVSAHFLSVFSSEVGHIYTAVRNLSRFSSFLAQAFDREYYNYI